MAMPSPLDLLHIILAQRWLFGALLSVGAASLLSAGVMLMKKAQYHVMGATSLDRYQPPPPLSKMLSRKRWWGGLVCFMVHSLVANVALVYAPESTVLPLSAAAIFLNFFLVQVFLYERIRREDKFGTLTCAVSTMVMNWSTPAWMKGAPGGRLVDFPIEKALNFTVETWGNTGFVAYLCVWVVLLAICFYVMAFVHVSNVARPFAIPVLIGLFTSQTHFLGKVSWTLIEAGYREPLSWWTSEHEAALLTVGVTVLMYLCTLLSVVYGLRLLSCRFFVPATVVAVELLTVTQLLLFFRTYEGMTYSDIVLFVVSSACAVVGMFFISPEQARIPSPKDAELNSPRPNQKPLIEWNDGHTIHVHRNVLAIIDEYQMRKPEPEHLPEPLLKTVNMNDFPIKYETCNQKALRYFPLTITLIMVVVPYSMIFYFDYEFGAFFWLTVFSLYQGWRLGVHIALFSYVGIKKMAHFENADFKKLYEDEAATNNPPHKGPKFTEVFHFVILPNYKEPMWCLEEAIGTIAASEIAKDQIIFVPAMELSEGPEVHEKAEQLKSTFRARFKDVFPTFHPKDLEGEQRGKSANTKWAFERVMKDYIHEKKYNVRNAIVTVADADSDFHAGYFAALTYYFCHAGGSNGETPDRYLTIWQSPILHFKNYRDQPALVRLASMVASQHELANLADPNATRVPYSTYSLSAVLAEGVGGWDPDFISEDWHMALKCFFATAGRLRISPIFLPVMNYAPVGDTTWQTIQERFVQAKRHALGFSELIYLLNHFWRVWKAIDTPWGKSLYKWRAMFVGVKLLMIHLVMAVFFINSPLNGWLISYFAHNKDIQALDTNSWTFLINCVFQSLALLSFMSIFVISALLYEAVKHRIVDKPPRESLSLRWRNEGVNIVVSLVQSLLLLMPLFAASSVTEWIAAWKCRKGHTFEYIVAARGDEGQPSAASGTA